MKYVDENKRSSICIYSVKNLHFLWLLKWSCIGISIKIYLTYTIIDFDPLCFSVCWCQKFTFPLQRALDLLKCYSGLSGESYPLHLGANVNFTFFREYNPTVQTSHLMVLQNWCLRFFLILWFSDILDTVLVNAAKTKLVMSI